MDGNRLKKILDTIGILLLVIMIFALIAYFLGIKINVQFKKHVTSLDYSEYISVDSWEIRDSNGNALSPTNQGVYLKKYQFITTITIQMPAKKKMVSGGQFSVMLPKNEVVGGWGFVESAYNTFGDANGVELGQWRLYNGYLEVVLGDNVAGLNKVTLEIVTGTKAFINETLQESMQYVVFGKVKNMISFKQGELDPLPHNDQKSAPSASNSKVQWLIHVNNIGATELSTKEFGTQFTVKRNTYLEDTLGGSYGNYISFVTAVYLPRNLEEGTASIITYTMDVNKYFSQIFPQKNETYAQFKSRMEPFEYGVYIDDKKVETLIINFGNIGENNLPYSKIDVDFARKAANYAIDNGFYKADQKDALVEYFKTTYGNGNVINGDVARFGIYFNETFPPVTKSTVVENIVRISSNGVTESVQGSATLEADSHTLK